MEIFFIFVLIIACCIPCYFIGKGRISHEIKLHNDTILEERKVVKKEIVDSQKRLEELDKEYDKKKQFIDDIKQRAEEEHNEKIQLLNKQFIYQEKELKREYQETQRELERHSAEEILQYKEKIDRLREELKKLSKTKAATIKAFQREEQLKAEKDNYRLDISDNDLNDVAVLQSVRPRLNRPRILDMLIWQTFWQPIAKKKFPLILGDKPVCGIYKITNLLNEKCYIGQARDVRKRFNEHCKCGLGIDTPQGNKLYQDMLKDSLENFTFELLEECEPQYLDEKEQFYINVYNSVEYGYNGRKQR